MSSLFGMMNEQKKQEGCGFRDFVKSLDYDSIGPDVSVYPDSSVLSDITAVCRRAFKKKDVIVLVRPDGDDDDYERGIVFTDSAIFSWEECGAELSRIPYDCITEVDYDESDIVITYANMLSKVCRITLDDSASPSGVYPRRMYNFVMDILDYLNEGSAEPAKCVGDSGQAKAEKDDTSEPSKARDNNDADDDRELERKIARMVTDIIRKSGGGRVYDSVADEIAEEFLK